MERVPTEKQGERAASGEQGVSPWVPGARLHLVSWPRGPWAASFCRKTVLQRAPGLWRGCRQPRAAAPLSNSGAHGKASCARSPPRLPGQGPED